MGLRIIIVLPFRWVAKPILTKTLIFEMSIRKNTNTIDEINE